MTLARSTAPLALLVVLVAAPALALPACQGPQAPASAPASPGPLAPGQLASATADEQASAGPSASVVPAGTTQPTLLTGASAPPPRPPRPRHRTPLPSSDEWSKVGEVIVEGSSALRCETKKVREYVRVVCTGSHPKRGVPLAAEVKSGGLGEAVVNASKGRVEVVLPFLEGVEAEIDFHWTHADHKLLLSWDYGGEAPKVLGAFVGAFSPLAVGRPSVIFTARSITWREAAGITLCRCYHKLGHASCDELPAVPNAGCASTYETDCEKMLACARGEPSALPSCPERLTLVQPGNTCALPCESSSPCMPWQVCASHDGGIMACDEP